MHRPGYIAAAIVLALIGAQSVGSAVTPAQKCRLGKTMEAGKYAMCRHKAEARYVVTGDAAARSTAFATCGDKLVKKWADLEAKAAAASDPCPTTGDDVGIQSVLATATTDVATELGGGVLHDYAAELAGCTGAFDACVAALMATPGVPLQTGQTRCWDTAGAVVSCAGTGQDGALQTGLARAYVDNGDGTITDTRTGLMWERLTDDGSIHDWDDTYAWADAFAVKIAALNAGAGFAGHTDWRLPNRFELETLVDLGRLPTISPPFDFGECGFGCTRPACSCTQTLKSYWSSSTYEPVPEVGWGVGYQHGFMTVDGKVDHLYVRAVRGPS